VDLLPWSGHTSSVIVDPSEAVVRAKVRTMRIGVLGGCGDMGSRAVEVLADRAEVDEVLILDRDRSRGEELAADLPGVRFVFVDADDRASVVETLRGLDAVAGALGPFYRFERPLAEAAIEAGVPYVSICDDHDATASVLQLDERARQAGVTVLTGLGWTPGLTNLAVRHLYDEFGGLDAARVFWGATASDSAGHAVVLHTMHVFEGYVPVVRDGITEQVRAGTGREPVVFPSPLGRVETCFVGHPEPVTLARFLPGLRRVELKGGLAEGYLNGLVRTLSRARLLATHTRRVRVAKVVEPLLPTLERFSPDFAASAWRVEGAYRGRTGAMWGLGHMADLTGTPLAIGALLLATGDISAPGVIAPESDEVPHEQVWKLLEEYGVLREGGAGI
jgi:lysine 6-dehydrogenase